MSADVGGSYPKSQGCAPMMAALAVMFFGILRWHSSSSLTVGKNSEMSSPPVFYFCFCFLCVTLERSNATGKHVLSGQVLSCFVRCSEIKLPVLKSVTPLMFNVKCWIDAPLCWFYVAFLLFSSSLGIPTYFWPYLVWCILCSTAELVEQ